MTMEDRLRQAIADHVATVPRPPDRWGEIEAKAAAAQRARRIRRRIGTRTVLGLAAAAAVAFVAIPLLRDQPSHHVKTAPAGPPPATGPAPGPVATAPNTSLSIPATTSGPATTTPSAPTTGRPAVAFPYQPLWPFRTQAEARTWEASYRSGGQQPWHLDAGQTALSFTDGYLGYAAINKVVKQTIGATDAHVAVGYDTPNGQPATAAVIHLVRFEPSGPWEVVGTDDTTLSITVPGYGSVVSSPVTVGGVITGVDESISVQVRQPSSAAPIGQSCCVPAGGTGTPWRTTVTDQGATDPVLTIAAATGGHLQAVERFTVTAVRTGL